MLNGLNSVASIFIMIGIGFCLAKIGLLNKQTNKLFSKIVIQVAVPLMTVVSIPRWLTLEELKTFSPGILLACIGMLLAYMTAYIISLFLKIHKKERGIFCALFSISNTIFIGLPVNISLYGEESIPYVFLFDIANILIFWTIGVYNIKKYSHKNNESGFLENIKNILSPPLIGFIIGILLLVFRLELPLFLENSFDYIGELSTPMAMLFIGTVIYSMDLKKIKINLTTFAILAGKFIISPLIMIGLLFLTELPGLLEKVFIIQSAGPMIIQIALVAEYYDVSSKYASFMVGLSTMLYMFVIPIYVFLIG